jgi:hypothetical protein
VFDKGVFAVHVGLYVVWEAPGEPPLELAISLRNLGMRNQVVAKRQVPTRLQTPDIEGMYLMRSDARRVVAPKVPTPRYTPLTLSLVPKCLEHLRPIVEIRETGHFDQHVDDRLRAETWNGRASDVVDLDHTVADGLPNALCFGLVSSWPARVVWHDANDHARSARQPLPRNAAAQRPRAAPAIGYHGPLQLLANQFD